jgi:hypothetical protein
MEHLGQLGMGGVLLDAKRQKEEGDSMRVRGNPRAPEVASDDYWQANEAGQMKQLLDSAPQPRLILNQH